MLPFAGAGPAARALVARLTAVILELALLTVHAGAQAAFEAAFAKAQRLLAGTPGYLSHELRQSLDCDVHYALLIEWRAVEDHTLGFRKSAEFTRWRELLHGHLAEPPRVEHYRSVPAPRGGDGLLRD